MCLYLGIANWPVTLERQRNTFFKVFDSSFGIPLSGASQDLIKFKNIRLRISSDQLSRPRFNVRLLHVNEMLQKCNCSWLDFIYCSEYAAPYPVFYHLSSNPPHIVFPRCKHRLLFVTIRCNLIQLQVKCSSPRPGSGSHTMIFLEFQL